MTSGLEKVVGVLRSTGETSGGSERVPEVPQVPEKNVVVNQYKDLDDLMAQADRLIALTRVRREKAGYSHRDAKAIEDSQYAVARSEIQKIKNRIRALKEEPNDDKRNEIQALRTSLAEHLWNLRKQIPLPAKENQAEIASLEEAAAPQPAGTTVEAFAAPLESTLPQTAAEPLVLTPEMRVPLAITKQEARERDYMRYGSLNARTNAVNGDRITPAEEQELFELEKKLFASEPSPTILEEEAKSSIAALEQEINPKTTAGAVRNVAEEGIERNFSDNTIDLSNDTLAAADEEFQQTVDIKALTDEKIESIIAPSPKIVTKETDLADVGELTGEAIQVGSIIDSDEAWRAAVTPALNQSTEATPDAVVVPKPDWQRVTPLTGPYSVAASNISAGTEVQPPVTDFYKADTPPPISTSELDTPERTPNRLVSFIQQTESGWGRPKQQLDAVMAGKKETKESRNRFIALGALLLGALLLTADSAQKEKNSSFKNQNAGFSTLSEPESFKSNATSVVGNYETILPDTVDHDAFNQPAELSDPSSADAMELDDYTIVKCDNLWDLAEGDVEGRDPLPALQGLNTAEKNTVLAHMVTALKYNPELMKDIGFVSKQGEQRDPNRIYPGEVVHTDVLNKLLVQIKLDHKIS